MQRAPSALLILFLGLTALFPVLGGSAGTASAEEMVTIDIEAGVEIQELLKAVSQQAGVAIMWDPGDKQIRGRRITGGAKIQVRKSRLIDKVRSILTFHELVIIPVGPKDEQVLLVMDARRTTSILKIKAEPIVLTDNNLESYAGADGRYVTTMIKVEHMKDLRNARNALTRLVTGQNIGNVVEVPDIPGFVVTDFAPNVVSIYRLIKQMDQPAAERTAPPRRGPARPAPATRELRIVPLEHANAMEAAATLGRLFPAPRPASPTRAAVTRGPKIQGDARTNKLLVVGYASEIEQVLEAVSALDSAASEPETHAHLIRLANMPAHEAAQVVNQAIMGSRTLWRDPSNLNNRPSVVPVQRVNAVIVSASDEAFNHIRQLIVELDEAAADKAEDDK